VPPQRSHRGGCPHHQLPGASHLQWSSPSLLSHLVKGWHAPPNACGAGAIVLLPQGDPPHSWFDSCHEYLEPPVDGSFVRQADRQPIIESDQQSQAELKLSTHPVTVVDGESTSRSHTPCRS
jgi:hypothetical protein